MYTKNDLKEHLKTMGLTGEETILIHSSMKSIGDVQDRAEGVLDVLIDYFKTDGEYHQFKVDILAGLITYSTDKNLASNLETISAERAWE